MNCEIDEVLKAHRKRLKFRLYTIPGLVTPGVLAASWFFSLDK